MTDPPPLRLRCPRDIAKPEPNKHVRVDVGQPITPTLLHRLLDTLDRCDCGALMVFLDDKQVDPWRRA